MNRNIALSDIRVDIEQGDLARARGIIIGATGPNDLMRAVLNEFADGNFTYQGKTFQFDKLPAIPRDNAQGIVLEGAPTEQDKTQKVASEADYLNEYDPENCTMVEGATLPTASE